MIALTKEQLDAIRHDFDDSIFAGHDDPNEEWVVPPKTLLALIRLGAGVIEASCDADLEAIERRLSAAAPGPWTSALWTDEAELTKAENGEPHALIATADGKRVVGAIYYDGFHIGCTEPDADFIANAPSDIRALLGMVREARSAEAGRGVVIYNDVIGQWSAYPRGVLTADGAQAAMGLVTFFALLRLWAATVRAEAAEAKLAELTREVDDAHIRGRRMGREVTLLDLLCRGVITDRQHGLLANEPSFAVNDFGRVVTERDAAIVRAELAEGQLALIQSVRVAEEEQMTEAEKRAATAERERDEATRLRDLYESAIASVGPGNRRFQLIAHDEHGTPYPCFGVVDSRSPFMVSPDVDDEGFREVTQFFYDEDFERGEITTVGLFIEEDDLCKRDARLEAAHTKATKTNGGDQ